MKADWDVGTKIQEVFQELKTLGLFREEIPQWVRQFKTGPLKHEQEFAEWLQFVYLPNCAQHRALGKNDIALQAAKYLGKDPSREKLLQLLIELDAL
jgi:uncharacterized protein YqcC (DUF446 family)